VANELFPHQDPIGAQISIRNLPFMVLGILAEKGQTGIGGYQDDVILAPDATMLYRLGIGIVIQSSIILISFLFTGLVGIFSELYRRVNTCVHGMEYEEDVCPE